MSAALLMIVSSLPVLVLGVSGCACEAIAGPPEVLLQLPADLKPHVKSIQLCLNDEPCNAMSDGSRIDPPGPTAFPDAATSSLVKA
jgi:hypothetical protein